MNTDVPEALKATNLQSAIAHTPWIDQIPFPKLRNNLIILNPVINETDFVQALFQPSSIKIRQLDMSHDPAAWLVGKSFWEEWGFMFY